MRVPDVIARAPRRPRSGWLDSAREPEDTAAAPRLPCSTPLIRPLHRFVLVAVLACGTTLVGQTPVVRLVDVAAEAGLDLVNVSGGPSKDFIVDANGNGAGWFDYDNDGDLDALIVNGSTRERFAKGGDLMAALYHNDGHGHFR